MWQENCQMWCWNCTIWDRIVKCEKKSKGTTKCDKTTFTCDIGTIQYNDGTVKCEKKNKGTIKCEKRTVTCDVGTAQCEDGTVTQYDKRTVICDKNRTVAMLVLLNVTMEPSNLRKKKNKGTIICDKRTVTCGVGTGQCEDETILPIPFVIKVLGGKFKPLNELLGNQTETQLWALEMTPIDFRCDNKPIQARRNKNCT